MCNEVGSFDSLRVEELPDPTAGAGQVVIRVAASSLNFPDVLLVQGKYQFKPPAPFSPGGEVAGTIAAVGPGVEGLAVGDPVVTTMPWGGWREAVVTGAELVMRIPEGIDLTVAASFPLVYGTSYYALKDRAALREGEWLCVLGAAGGVGLAAVELGKRMGAKVLACASSDDKLALCRARGADATINYATEDLKARIKAITGRGADVIYDPVGGRYSEAALRAIAWYGRFLVVGFAGNDIPAIPLNLVLLKSCQIVGVFWGQFTVQETAQHQRNSAELFRWLAAGELKPHVSRRYRFDEAAQALHAMMERRVQGKVVLVP